MGYNEDAVRKGTISELLAQIYWLSKGYNILVPLNHESKFDFAVMSPEDNRIQTVQVKSAILSSFTEGSPALWRARNKRGCNGSYQEGDYDLLHVVREYDATHWIIPYTAIKDRGETLTLERVDGKPLRSNSRCRDLVEYKCTVSTDRQKVLDDLSALDQELGLE